MCAQWKRLLRTREQHRRKQMGVQPVPQAVPPPAPPQAVPPPAPPQAQVEEEWPSWLAAADDGMLDALASVIDEEISHAQPEPATHAQNVAPPPVSSDALPSHVSLAPDEPATKRRKCGPAVPPAFQAEPAASAPSPPEPPAAPAPALPAPPATAASAAAAASVGPGSSSIKGQQLDTAAVLQTLPPALFSRSQALEEYRAAYRSYRMGAARGAAGEEPAHDAPRGSGGGPSGGPSGGPTCEERPSTAAASTQPRASGDAQRAGRSAALARLAQAVRLLPDFSALLPSDYRQRYGAWRAGSAVGAKGETGAAAAAATGELPRQAWVQEVSSIADESWTQQIFLS